MGRGEFVAYLRDTLIPDLRESGRHATAEDFLAAVAFIEDPELEEVEIGG